MTDKSYVEKMWTKGTSQSPITYLSVSKHFHEFQMKCTKEIFFGALSADVEVGLDITV